MRKRIREKNGINLKSEKHKSQRGRKNTVRIKESEKVKRPQKSRMRKTLIKITRNRRKEKKRKNRETGKRSITKGTKIRLKRGNLSKTKLQMKRNSVKDLVKVSQKKGA